MKKIHFHILLLFILPFSAYIFLLNGPGYFDDLVIFQGNAWLYKGPSPSWFHVVFFDSQQTFAGYRPVLMQISQWSSQILGYDFFSWRLFNLLIHIGNGILFYILLRSLKVKHVLAWLTSLLFLIHPIHTLSVQFVWKRSALLSIFFMLMGLCFYAYQHYFGRLKKFNFFLQIILLTLAFGCKEIAMIYPFLLLAYHLFKNPRIEPLLRSEKIGFLCLFLWTVGLCWLRLSYVQTLIAPSLANMAGNRSFEHNTYFFSSMRSVMHYMGWFFVPKPLLLNDPLPVKHMLNLFSFAYIGLFLLSCWSLLSQRLPHALAFFVCVFWLSFIPHTSVYPMFTLEDQIRCYLAYASLAYISMVALNEIITRLTRFKLQNIVSLILVGLLSMTVLQNIKYYSPSVIWSDVIDEYPHSDYAQSSLGDALYAKEKYAESVNCYRQAYASSKVDYYKVKVARSLWKAQNDKQVVYAELKQVDFNKLNIEEFSDFLMLFIMMHDFEKAEKLLSHVIGRFHNNEKLVFTAGKLYFERAEYKKAVIFFTQVLKLNPYHQTAAQYLLKSNQYLDQEK